MVKPQSSKLITRVRFPSSPRDFRVSTLSRRGPFFFPRGDDGNPFRMRICFLARSESARSSSSSPPQIPLKVAGNRLRLKVPKAFETFRLQPVIPRELISGNPFRMRICFLARSESARSSSSSPPQILFKVDGNRLRAKIHSLARSESAHSSLLIYTPQAPAAPRRPWRIHRATPQHCRGAPSPGRENHRHHQKAQRLRRHPQQEPPENHNLPPSAQW